MVTPTDRIEQLQSGVAPAFALLAGMQLGVFTALGDTSRSAAEIASILGVSPDRLQRLLYALVSTGLLKHDEAGFRNTTEAAEQLVEGKPGYIGGVHNLLAELWQADLHTAASIRSGRPEAAHDFSNADPAAALTFMRGLVPSGLGFGRALAKLVDFAPLTSVIDIGGGPGSALVGLRERWPHLTGTLMELPETLAVVAPLLAEQGQQVALEPGDITRAPSTRQHDAAILKAVVQVLSPEAAAKAIRHAAGSLRVGGELFISGAGILDDSRTSPAGAVFFNLTFLNLYQGGESYTEAQYRAWLEAAGFAEIRRSRLETGANLIRAVKIA
ncbi:MAG: 16S rRNA methyltransferase [Cereibacter sphaeroides]|uniref:16S rRNA methyltransferase n=1 Tax=Cereibacter sphaeroides TaxID=1063 RepID=A0A2W5SAL8_CERSP|nr:MAG: 16S rRNA methyltransferase [Cereibacter sphaeroides]